MSAVTFNYLITGMPEQQNENAMAMLLWEKIEARSARTKHVFPFISVSQFEPISKWSCLNNFQVTYQRTGSYEMNLNEVIQQPEHVTSAE